MFKGWKKGFPFGEMFGFGDFDKEFKKMQRIAEEMMGRKLEDLEDRPLVYGFSVKRGSDGVPHVKEFGNAKSYLKSGAEGTEWTPLTDVQECEDKILVNIEIPGVEKEDIDLQVREDKLDVKVDGARRYSTSIKLPSEAKIEDAEASYKNGILEVKLNRKEYEESEGRSIEIE